MIPFLTVLDKCQYIASFWMLFSIWERPCVQKEMIKPNSKYVHITGYSWIKYQEKIYSLGDHSGNGKVIFSFFGTMIGTGIYRSWFLSTEAISWNWAEKKYFLVLLLTLYLVTSVYIEVISKRSTERCKL